MTAAVKTSGSQLSVVGSEHTLATITDPGTYAPVIDASAMAAGDITEIRVYGKCRSGDPEQLALPVVTLVGPQATALKVLEAILSPHHYKVTLKQVAGSPKTYFWAVYQS